MSAKEATSAELEPLIHIMVIGFHHKKGCQLEYAYPGLGKTADSTSSLQLPNNWKHLPSLALPDGSHNHDNDSVFFHLIDDFAANKSEPVQAPNQQVFISCMLLVILIFSS
jgi:hypothetical protein